MQLLRQRFNQEREIFIYKIYYSEQQNHGHYTNILLIAADISGPFVVFVPEAAFKMLSGNIFLIFRLGEIAIFLPAFLCLRIIKARLVIESSNLLCAEKTEIE